MFSFARTKIQPPRARRGSILDRPALRARLVDALTSATLVLLRAPAGFGKTSALVQALDTLPASTAVAWVSCDEADLPIELFACLVTALDGVDLPWRVSPESLMAAAAADGAPAPQSRALQAMVTELVNALDASDVARGVIAIDDLHRIAHPAVHEFLGRLLERLPERWTVAVATRDEPPVALARVRARGELLEIRAADLRFDLDLTTALLRDAGIDAGLAAALQVRTQGWPAGLRLGMSALQDESRPRMPVPALMDREMFDFVAVEILDRLAPDLRRFAMQCSVLPELTAARCQALTGDPLAAQHLDTIERGGLFVTRLGEADAVLRFHDLFRDALLQCLHREPALDAVGLLRRAADSEPDGLRRIDFLLRAQDWSRAADEVHGQVPALVTSGRITLVEHLLDRFPEPVRQAEPRLQLARAILHWGQWRWPDMLEAGLTAAGMFELAGDSLEALRARAYARVGAQGGGLSWQAGAAGEAVSEAVGRVMTARAADIANGVRYDDNEAGITAAMLDALVRGWDAYHAGCFGKLPEIVAGQTALLAATRGPDAVFRMMPLPGFVGLPGMAPSIARFIGLAGPRVVGAGEHLTSLVRGLQGSHQIWQGDVVRGRALLREAAQEVQWHDFPLRSTLYVFVRLVAADALAGDHDALLGDARDLLAVFDRAGPRTDLAVRVASETLAIGRWLFAAGESQEALRVWARLDALDGRPERPMLAAQRLSLAGWRALAEARLTDSETAFERVLATHGPALELFGQASDLRLRLAQLRLRLGRGPQAAAEALMPLFTRHALDADIAAIWLAGATLLTELADAAWGDTLDAVEIDRLRRWATGANALAVPGTPTDDRARPSVTSASGPGQAAGGPLAPTRAASAAGPGRAALSERELEVLARIAAGDSNKIIARELDLSPHTVKRHVANILDKLDLRSRGQASAWFHQHRH
ncbi:MAG: LuxR C-terminal-related transcriptional regulator [Burkholderiaceae bacterium]